MTVLELEKEINNLKEIVVKLEMEILRKDKAIESERDYNDFLRKKCGKLEDELKEIKLEDAMKEDSESLAKYLENDKKGDK